ncbi:acyl-CoA dehydrogenase family protein [Streptomyces spiralis]|uniref:acyl-CoA dehydrogenase family protein n=1 Tax=Streptomyces spiralis TaxID=66376 RepID=UPI0033F94692
MSVAHVIANDAGALAVAAEPASDFRKGAAERDARRRLPHTELERLLAATVPAGFGGADIRADTLAEIFRLPAAADAGLARIPQSHFVYVNVLRRQGSERQQEFGEPAMRERAAGALLRETARAVDDARAGLTDDSAAEASIAVATAKVTAAEAAVEVASALFEVSGTRSALGSLGLHRHWRDARTDTLYDPARWKIKRIGRYVLNRSRPPRHGLL